MADFVFHVQNASFIRANYGVTLPGVPAAATSKRVAAAAPLPSSGNEVVRSKRMWTSMVPTPVVPVLRWPNSVDSFLETAGLSASEAKRVGAVLESQVCVCVCVCVYVHMCMCVCVCVYVCMHVCVSE